MHAYLATYIDGHLCPYILRSLTAAWLNTSHPLERTTRE